MDDLEYLTTQASDKGPSIVFFNGFRMPYTSWKKVYSGISESQNIFLYNRPGVGKSPKTQRPQTGIQIVQDLAHLLTRENLPTPYVLVGHSLGGLFSRLFAAHYPDKVKGLVLVESPHSQEVIRRKEVLMPKLLHYINQGLKRIEMKFDPFKFSEDEEIDKTLVQLQTSKLETLRNISLISGTKKMPFIPDTEHKLHLHYQSKLSNELKATHYLFDHSGHFPQLSEAEGVIEVIRKTIKNIR